MHANIIIYYMPNPRQTLACRPPPLPPDRPDTNCPGRSRKEERMSCREADSEASCRGVIDLGAPLRHRQAGARR